MLQNGKLSVNCQLLNILAAYVFMLAKHCKNTKRCNIVNIEERNIDKCFPLNPCNPSITKRLVLNQINLFSSSFNLKAFSSRRFPLPPATPACYWRTFFVPSAEMVQRGKKDVLYSHSNIFWSLMKTSASKNSLLNNEVLNISVKEGMGGCIFLCYTV